MRSLASRSSGRPAPRRPGDPAALFAASDRLQRELGWTPRFPSLRQIVQHAWEWHQTHPQGYRRRRQRRRRRDRLALRPDGHVSPPASLRGSAPHADRRRDAGDAGVWRRVSDAGLADQTDHRRCPAQPVVAAVRCGRHPHRLLLQGHRRLLLQLLDGRPRAPSGDAAAQRLVPPPARPVGRLLLTVDDGRAALANQQRRRSGPSCRRRNLWRPGARIAGAGGLCRPAGLLRYWSRLAVHDGRAAGDLPAGPLRQAPSHWSPGGVRSGSSTCRMSLAKRSPAIASSRPLAPRPARRRSSSERPGSCIARI